MLKNSEIKKAVKIGSKLKRKLYLQGFKSVNKFKKSQNEIDLINIEKIKSCTVNGKIAVLKTNENFYDSFDFNVKPFYTQNIRIIPAHYTAYRLLLKDFEHLADRPFSVEIKKPTEFFELKHI
tara:strand:+ start:166 stop:534 length:369 start_codon:yes stop_codon:yes gene_type:complete